MTNELRYRLVLGKYPVVRVSKGASAMEIALQLPQGIKILLHAPLTSDIKE